jgi:hypothetical protein
MVSFIRICAATADDSVVLLLYPFCTLCGVGSMAELEFALR